MRRSPYARLMIVDGYNVIRSSPVYSSLIDDDPEITDVYVRAREALITDVATAAQGSHDAIVVFDGGGNPYSEGKDYRTAGIRVCFSPYKKEADELIEKLARSARVRGQEVLVVTSDAATQWTVVGDGVTRQSSRMFIEDLGLAQKEYEQNMHDYSKASIQGRIPKDVAEKLRRMARGETI